MTVADNRTFTSTVAAGDSGIRLDVYLVEKEELDLSRSQIQRLVQEGKVRVNGQVPGKAGQRLKAGDLLEVMIPPPVAAVPAPEEITLAIVYEDLHLAVIDKPAGMVVHPAPGHYSGTLVNALLFHCGDLSGIGGVLRPGIVHRLDKDTSGLLVIAKSQTAHDHLIRQLKERRVRRTYLTLVRGRFTEESGLINAPLGRHPVKRKQMSVVRGGKEAITHYWVLEQFSAYSYLKVKLETGRTHQIRVHMAHIGHPVVGDPLYGSGKKELGLKRQALHAAGLSFIHPVLGREMEFSSPLPPDIKKALILLRGLDKSTPLC